MTYVPEHFEQNDPAAIDAFLKAHRFATAVVNRDGVIAGLKDRDTGDDILVRNFILANHEGNEK